MSKPRFAVIGAGPGGLAIAGHLALLGHRVTLFNRTAERITDIRQRGGVRLTGVVEGTGRIELVTSDIGQALESVKTVIVVVPAFAHGDVAKRCSPYLRAGQTILLMPGRTGGAIEFARVLETMGVDKTVTVAEAQTILHTCRPGTQEGEVVVFSTKQHIPVASLPASKTDAVLELIAPVFPQFTKAESVLETSMGNVGAILHPAPTLLNVGWIETLRTQFLHYYEGITQSVADFIEQLDQERLAVAHSMGAEVLSVKEWLAAVYGVQGMSLHDAIQQNNAYRDIYAPKTIQHRYVYEDVPTGLVPMASLGKALGVDTPCMDVIIKLASFVCGVDFQAQGRTANKLGVTGLDREGLRHFVERYRC